MTLSHGTRFLPCLADLPRFTQAAQASDIGKLTGAGRLSQGRSQTPLRPEAARSLQRPTLIKQDAHRAPRPRQRPPQKIRRVPPCLERPAQVTRYQSRHRSIGRLVDQPIIPSNNHFHSARCSRGSLPWPKTSATRLPMLPGEASTALPQLPLAVFKMLQSMAPSRGLRLGCWLFTTALL